MAEENNVKKENKENKEGGTRHRSPRPYHKGGHGGKGRGGAKPKPQTESKESAKGQEQTHKKPHQPHHQRKKEEQKPKSDAANLQRREEQKPKSDAANLQRREEQKPKSDAPHPQRREGSTPREQSGRRTEGKRGVSGRLSSAEVQRTAEQKAFAEAKDIMLEAEANRKNGVITEEDAGPKVEVVGVRFKTSGKIYYFAPKNIAFDAGDGVIVETARGQEYGFVALANRMVSEKETVPPLKEVVRKATEQDYAKHLQNKELEKKAAQVWEELVTKHKLIMSLTDVEYTFDNSKLIFYFTADGRVDFRELVKDLASVFRTRIELRQIGVRDEAKLLGGLGVCGMPFCCNRFLPDFVQVSIKMAKEQNLSLSSSKISGNCGRLMCCLRYEQDVYEAEYSTFPRVDMVVRTEVGTGVITESNFLNGKIKVRMDGDGTAVYKVFTRDEVKVIGKAKTKSDDALEKELKALED